MACKELNLHTPEGVGFLASLLDTNVSVASAAKLRASPIALPESEHIAIQADRLLPSATG